MKRCLAAALALLTLSGCTGNVTPIEYARLRVNMPYNEVVRIIGSSPDSCTDVGATRTCTWSETNRSRVLIMFQSDRVTSIRRQGSRRNRRVRRLF